MPSVPLMLRGRSRSEPCSIVYLYASKARDVENQGRELVFAQIENQGLRQASSRGEDVM